MGGWKQYVDLLFLAAIAEQEQGKSKDYLQRGLKMGDGKGFSDLVAQAANTYATYKLALALLAASRIGVQFDARSAVLDRLLAQQAPDGGWVTDYDKDGKPVGVANVETTSLAILAVEAVERGANQ
jgi:hypothetical protein